MVTVPPRFPQPPSNAEEIEGRAQVEAEVERPACGPRTKSAPAMGDRSPAPYDEGAAGRFAGARVIPLASARASAQSGLLQTQTRGNAMPSNGPHSHNTLVNGVDVATIRMLIEATETAPEMAQARYRVGTIWKPSPEGSWVQINRYGLKDCDTDDEGDPTPEEQLLSVVNSCLILSLRVRCALEGLHLDLIEVTTTADSDLRGLVGLPTATPGLQAIDTQIGFGGQEAAERLQVVAQEVLSASSILACLRRPVTVSTRVAV